MKDDATPPVALSIAGSDASGGAGIQADLRTFAAHQVHGTTAIAALTAQNTVGVQGLHVVPPGFVADQVRSITSDLSVRAVKTGMLATADVVREVANLAAEGLLPNLVVDPVMVASTGARLLDRGAEDAYRSDLLPQAMLMTPNAAEASVLLGRELTHLGDVLLAAEELLDFGTAVLVTGGDSDNDDEIVDVLCRRTPDGPVVETLTSARVHTANDHGSGCSLSSAIAARLAHGDDLLTAIDNARAFVSHALQGGATWRLGQGHGPLDHLGWNDASTDSHRHWRPRRARKDRP